MITALSVAGSDPSGGAGIQADLKTFSALGVYGTTVISALVAQNTRGVTAIHRVPGSFVATQLDSLFADVRVDAVKIGMLASVESVRAVAVALERYQPPFVVLDPVMIATSGDRLVSTETVAAIRRELVPLVDLVTPNIPEAAYLTGETEAVDEEGMVACLERLRHLCRGVLLKGGHREGAESVDFLQIEGRVTRLSAVRVSTRNTHGTGCTLSAAIAALRPQRPDWVAAVTDAKGYVSAALLAADTLSVGGGSGPVHHFHALWPPPP